ncbi:MAG: DNA polymerase III subunit gamma/tau [Planctomycetia bacterium]|nr:DNA polymerase III subunit gamma/tau [Planctomycetia bacterium]
MEYTVLARRFRPQSFGEVVGQENIAQALRNAIASGRVAHAYLFTGARGVGKTSTARILAKSLNCPNAVNGDPCNQCEICRGVSTGSDVDVIEIDGASNRGIDEIRDLRANVNVKPMRTRYKIYIIDEVHMLTAPAFNALLKTLEEPPPNVKFIFCTTDPQKLPDTILSRCQRFDFGTIATSSIGRRLAEIAETEGVVVDAKAIQLVARRAAGSMRDSQSLFDQLLAFGGKSIGPADVHRLLGTAPDERLVDLGDAMVARDPARALALLDESLQAGVQVSELADQLLGYFRDLMVLAAGAGEAALLSVEGEQRAKLAGQASAAGLQTVLASLQILAEAKHRMKGATFSRVLIELALVRISTLEQLDDLGEIVARLKQSPSVAPGPAARSVSRVLPAPATNAPVREAAPSPRESDGRSQVLPSPAPATPPAAAAWIPPSPVEAVADANGLQCDAGTNSETPTDDQQGVERLGTIPFEMGRESEIWSQVLTFLSDMTRTNAKNVSRTAISGPNSLVLTFPKSYYLSKQYLERSPEQLSRVEKALERVVGRPIRVTLAVDESEAPARERQLEEPVTDPKTPDAGRDPLVQRALAVFGATVIKTETRSGQARSQE